MAGLYLNLGCGSQFMEGYVNVDKFGDPEVQLDLETFPWPWEDNSVAGIELRHVLEHLGQDSDTYFKIIQEIYRICEPGAIVHIVVPHHRHDNFVHDPTHVRPITFFGLAMFSKRLNREWQANGYATTPLGLYLDVDFEWVTVCYVGSNVWERLRFGKTDEEKRSLKLLEQSAFFNNLIDEVDITLEVVK